MLFKGISTNYYSLESFSHFKVEISMKNSNIFEQEFKEAFYQLLIRIRNYFAKKTKQKKIHIADDMILEK